MSMVLNNGQQRFTDMLEENLLKQHIIKIKECPGYGIKVCILSLFKLFDYDKILIICKNSFEKQEYLDNIKKFFNDNSKITVMISAAASRIEREISYDLVVLNGSIRTTYIKYTNIIIVDIHNGCFPVEFIKPKFDKVLYGIEKLRYMHDKDEQLEKLHDKYTEKLNCLNTMSNLKYYECLQDFTHYMDKLYKHYRYIRSKLEKSYLQNN